MRLDRPSEETAPEDVDRVLARLGTHSLVSGLGDERGARGDRALDRGDLLQLLDERLLPVDVLPCAKRPEVDDGVVVVGRADDDAVELVAVSVEGLAEVAAGERLGVLPGNLGERVRIDVAEPGEDDIGVRLQLVAVGRRDRSADADLEELQLAELAAERAPRAWGREPERRRRERAAIEEVRGGDTTRGGRGGPDHVSAGEHGAHATARRGRAQCGNHDAHDRGGGLEVEDSRWRTRGGGLERRGGGGEAAPEEWASDPASGRAKAATRRDGSRLGGMTNRRLASYSTGLGQTSTPRARATSASRRSSVTSGQRCRCARWR